MYPTVKIHIMDFSVAIIGGTHYSQLLLLINGRYEREADPITFFIC